MKPILHLDRDKFTRQTSGLKMLNRFFLKSLTYLLLVMQVTYMLAQEPIAPNTYLIRFNNKDQSVYQLFKPDQFLASKALQRRQNQNIPIKANDLPVNPTYIDSLRNMGFVVLNTSKWLNAVSVQLTDTLLFDKLKNISFVKQYTKPGLKKAQQYSHRFTESITTSFEKSSADFYGLSYGQISIHHGDYIHSLGFRGQGMLIAVIDAGFNKASSMSAFDSLWSQNRVTLTRDIINPKADVFLEDSHGSMVLSTMASTRPGYLVGTAPMANYLLLRSENAFSEYLIEEFNWSVAAELADSIGADIISTSLGYSQFDDSTMNHTYQDMNGRTAMVSIAASVASSKGMIVVVSAGNEGADAWKYITAPADADSVLTVGAIGAIGVKASFSSVGPTFDRRIKPDVVALGLGTVVQTPTGTIVKANGTSFSAPIMAGLTACLWQSSPEKTNMDIINAIRQSSSQYNSPDSLMGYGIPDFSRAYVLLHPGIQLGIDQHIAASPSIFISDFNLVFDGVPQGLVNLSIFDLSGKKVLEKQLRVISSGTNVIHIAELASYANGLYVVRLTSDHQSIVCKIIK